MHSWKRHTLEKQQEALQEAFPSSQPMEIEVESSDENEHLQQDDAAPIEAPVPQKKTRHIRGVKNSLAAFSYTHEEVEELYRTELSKVKYTR